MRTETKIARYGNSLTVRLPVGVTRELDLREGDRVMLRTSDEGVIIERTHRTRLAARLATVNEREAEVLTGPAMGTEALD